MVRRVLASCGGKLRVFSARVLTERLRMLEQQGLVYRHYEATIPPAVTYGLTERIKDIRQIMEMFEPTGGQVADRRCR
ncbi:MAG TPA: winged helix-turn-helix transcriptional regulator [Terriglobales bacterium]|jgi:DNA-binding HxlR family transcriptional regulator